MMRSNAPKVCTTLLLTLVLFLVCCPVSGHSFYCCLSALQDLGHKLLGPESQGLQTTGQADAVPYADADWDYWTNPGAIFPVDLDVTVGIGTDTPDPSYKLDVLGDARIAGNLEVEGYISGALEFDYDSYWQSIGAGDFLTLNHNLSGDPEKYVVFVDGMDPQGRIHQANYGTLSYYTVLKPRVMLGVEWLKLTSSSITLWRGDDDDNTNYVAEFRMWHKVRVRILYNQE